MSANVTASLLLPSHAMPNRALHVAHLDSHDPGGGFDSLLAGLDQPNAPIAASPTGATAGSSSPHAATSYGSEGSAPQPAKVATKVDAALSLLGPVAFLAPTQAASAPLTRSLAAPPTHLASSAQPTANAITDIAPALEAAFSTSSASPSGSDTNVRADDLSSVLSPGSTRAVGTKPDFETPATSAGPTPGAALGAIAYTTTRTLAVAPELGFQSLQTKTFLAASDVESAALASLQGQGDMKAVAAGLMAAANVAPRAQVSPQGEPSASRKTSATAGLPGAAIGEAAASPLPLTANAAPRVQANPQNEPSSSQNPGRGGIGPVQPQAVAVKTPEAPAAIGIPASVSQMSADANVVNLSDLGDRLVNEAQTLVQPNVQTNTPLAAGPLKQLQLNLQPAHLGAVAVTLKMTQGKLSVDVGVANPNALAEVEGQRDTIVSKLQAGAQPLESFVVHQQTFSEAPIAPTSSNPQQTGSSGNASGNDSFSPDARDRAPRQPRTPATPNVAPPRNPQRADWVV